MIIGKVPTPNLLLNTLYTDQSTLVDKLLTKVDKDLCNTGKTEAHANVAIYNSLIVYLSLIYSDVNSNKLNYKDESYFKCKYNWETIVKHYNCLGYNLNKFAELLNLFTKQGTEYCNIYCT